MTGPTLVIIGPMGAGKTSIGKKVAKTLGVAFADSDALISRTHGPIADLIDRVGEAEFRAIEHDAIVQALSTHDGVLALGGGAVLHPDTRDLLRRERVGYLTVGIHRVPARIQGPRRPLLDGDDPVARWQEIFEARRALYEELADETFDSSEGTMSSIAETMIAWVRGASA